jgi:hypothetical protein
MYSSYIILFFPSEWKLVLVYCMGLYQIKCVIVKRNGICKKKIPGQNVTLDNG